MSDNENPVAIAALSRKRAEIAGLVIALEKRLAEHREDLVHIDNALRLMNSPLPGDMIPARRPRLRNSGYFVHGELSRRIYEALREREIITAAELADTALADKGIADKGVRATFVARFLVRLDQMAASGTIERVGRGNGVKWRIKSIG